MSSPGQSLMVMVMVMVSDVERLGMRCRIVLMKANDGIEEACRE